MNKFEPLADVFLGVTCGLHLRISLAMEREAFSGWPLGCHLAHPGEHRLLGIALLAGYLEEGHSVT